MFSRFDTILDDWTDSLRLHIPHYAVHRRAVEKHAYTGNLFHVTVNRLR